MVATMTKIPSSAARCESIISLIDDLRDALGYRTIPDGEKLFSDGCVALVCELSKHLADLTGVLNEQGSGAHLGVQAQAPGGGPAQAAAKLPEGLASEHDSQ